MVEIRAQAPHPGQGVADRLGEFGLAGDLWQPGLQPGFQSIEDRFGAGLPELDPLNGHTAAGILLDDVEPGDALDGFLGDDRALRLEDIGELAPDMGHAGDFIDTTGSVELVEPGIAVRVHPALVPGQVFGGVLALAIDGELIPCRWWVGAAPWPFVANIGPDPGGLAFAGALHLHLQGGVVGKDRLAALNMAPDHISQWFQQCRRFADPVGQGRAVEINAVAIEYPGLAIEREVIGILRDQHMGQQARAGTTPLDRARGQWCLADRLATRASHAGPDKAVHDEPARDVFQLFGDIFAEFLQNLAALAAGLAGRQHLLVARQAVRQRFALWFVLRPGDSIRRRRRRDLRRRDLFLFEPEFKLIHRLRLRAKPMAAMTGELVFQLGDPERLGLDRRHQLPREHPQFRGIIGQ